MNLKKLFVAVGLLMGCVSASMAQQAVADTTYYRPKRLMIINGLFFDEQPEPLLGEMKIGILKDSVYQKISLMEYDSLSDEAKAFAIPKQRIERAEALLEAARQKSMVKVYTVNQETLVKVGDRFPDFTLKDTHGNTWSGSDLKGKRTVLNFWFVGCGACRREMPALSRLAEKYPDLRYLAVTYNDAQSIAPILEKEGFTYHQLVDAQELVDKVGVTQYPLTVVLNEEGVITYLQTGTSLVQMQQLEQAISNR